MNTLLALFLLASINLLSVESFHPWGVQECEEGTHAYTIRCGYMTPEATCDNPYPETEMAPICDYSACYCNEPTVRDTTTNQCVSLNECSGINLPCY